MSYAGRCAEISAQSTRYAGHVDDNMYFFQSGLIVPKMGIYIKHNQIGIFIRKGANLHICIQTDIHIKGIQTLTYP